MGDYSVLSTFLTSNAWPYVNALEKPNKKHQVFSHPPWDIIDSLRAGPVKTYLPLVKKLRNFKPFLLTEVVQAIRNGTKISSAMNKNASTGAKQIINLKLGGKLILASGALSTLRILFNSGIGPSDQLQIVANGTTGVTLPAQSRWINLLIGRNLQDHPIFTLSFTKKQNQTTMIQKDFTNPSQHNIDLYNKVSEPLAQSGQRLNFWTSTNLTNDSYRFFQGTCNSPSPRTTRIKTCLTDTLTSSGRLGITSTGATAFIEKPWLNTAEDKAAFVDFSNQLLGYSRAENSIITLSTYTNGTSVTEADLLSKYSTGSHFVRSAKMQTSPDDTNAVVDTDLEGFGDGQFVRC